MATIAEIKAFRSHLAAGQRTPIHRELASVVDACLQQDPAKRPADAGAVAERLGGLLAKGVEDPAWNVVTLPAGAPARVSRRAIGAALAALALPVVVVAGRRWLPPRPLAEARRSIGRPPRQEADWWETSVSLPEANFRFGFVEVFDDDADRYLVEATGMLRRRELFHSDETTYWQPAEKGIEGRLVYRFDLPGPSRRAHLRTYCALFDEDLQLGVLGKGAGAIDASRDGVTWISLADGIAPRRWGFDLNWFDMLPDSLMGTAAIWLRIRLIAGGKGSPTVYSPAQFSRVGADQRQRRLFRFLIEAECAPARGAQAG